MIEIESRVAAVTVRVVVPVTVPDAALIVVLPEPAEVIAWLGGRLARYKIPRRIDISTALPRDENGKIATRRIRDKYWEGQQRRI